MPPGEFILVCTWFTFTKIIFVSLRHKLKVFEIYEIHLIYKKDIYSLLVVFTLNFIVYLGVID